MVRKNRPFELMVPQPPAGDQPAAIAELVTGTRAGKRFQTLLGATGTGKTRTIAHVIADVQRPTLVVAHNKTLAAQLCNELRSYFPKNAVEYFISYYDHYQPEAYVPSTDTYIEKSANINDEIDKLRHSATRSLFERRDVIVVASVSCIYGLGLPEEYLGAAVQLEAGAALERDDLLRRLVDIHYERNDMEMAPGRFRVRGDVVEIGPSYEDQVLRIEFFGDEVERISVVDPVTGQVVSREQELTIYPAKHFITPPDRLEAALLNIEEELRRQVAYFKANDKLLEAQRIFQRTKSDLEMLREFGYCNGVENYSQPLSAREPGSPPNTLLDYFPDDFLMIIDESHVMLPQLRGMYNGDRSRKETLVEYGFRLPSALDNRPLKFDEFMGRIGQTIYVSATPGEFELETSDKVVEQIIRPTGLLDPQVYVRPIEGQIDDLLEEVRRRIDRSERVLVTTLTKKSAEDLTDYMRELSLRVRYLHSDIQSLERIEILHDLRAGQFDVLVGVNLLREGLDLPEVSLVVILDADKEGFLRAEKSLVQMIGRAARHQAGEVIMYADNLTNSMERALAETERRRRIQLAYNEQHGITPRTVVKEIQDSILQSLKAGESAASYRVRHEAEIPVAELPQLIRGLEQEMREAAKLLEFERAAELRDKIKRLREQQLAIEKGSK